MNMNLLQHFTKDEIWAAVKSMDPLKASGIDGFSTLFYQHFWHIVGLEVSSFCLVVIRGEITIEEINQTHIVLIPKVSNPNLLLNLDL